MTEATQALMLCLAGATDQDEIGADQGGLPGVCQGLFGAPKRIRSDQIKVYLNVSLRSHSCPAQGVCVCEVIVCQISCQQKLVPTKATLQQFQ